MATELAKRVMVTGLVVTLPMALAGTILFGAGAGAGVVGGALVALAPGGCGAATCAPLWSSAAGSPLRVQPGVATDVVFVGAEDGTVSAFATAGCVASPCAPLWSDGTGSAITAL